MCAHTNDIHVFRLQSSDLLPCYVSAMMHEPAPAQNTVMQKPLQGLGVEVQIRSTYTNSLQKGTMTNEDATKTQDGGFRQYNIYCLKITVTDLEVHKLVNQLTEQFTIAFFTLKGFLGSYHNLQKCYEGNWFNKRA